jgi:3-hydroxyisobutyrate dehydrogenase
MAPPPSGARHAEHEEHSMARVGFIGVGNMGAPMARNLIKAGHSLKVFDLNEEAVNFVVQSGAKRAASVQDAAKGVDFVVTMLPVGANVRSVFLADGVIAAADTGTVLIDSSTIDVDSARAVHAAAAECGFAMLDAPVSGGVTGADAATLTFMCGGDKATFAKALPLLQGMGKNIVHCGGPGFGQVTKICNNMVAGIITLATAEAFVMGERLGVARQTLYDVMSTSSAASFILSRMCPVPGPVPTSAASNGYKPGFMAKLMLKDLRLAQAAAQMAETATPLGAAATAAFAMHVANGYGDLDMSSIVKLINKDA